MITRLRSGNGPGVLALIGFVLGQALHAVLHLRGHIANALERETEPPRYGSMPQWQPEDPDRFNTGYDSGGSFNPRYGGYDGYDGEIRETAFPQPRVRRPLVVQMPAQPAHYPDPGEQHYASDPHPGDQRVEPYFDNHRPIPRHHPQHYAPPQAPAAPPQAYAAQPYEQAASPAPPHHYSPQPAPAPAPAHYAPPPQSQPQQPIVSPPAPNYAAAPPQPAAHYANENYEDTAYSAQAYGGQAHYNEPQHYEQQAHQQQALHAQPQTPQAAPVIRGQSPTLVQQNMPDRSAQFGAEARLTNGRDYQAGDFVLPPRTLLTPSPPRQNDPELSDAALGRRAELLQSVLEDFRIKGQITGVHPGPVITLYEFEPARGTKSSRVIGLADDIARSMSAVSARVAVIPGRDAIGIELPNQNREVVYLRQLLEAKDFSEGKGRLQLALGKTIGGEPVIVDLARMPHLLIAGTTGSGKSVAINTMILSLLYRLPPEECRFIMIDPKMLELSVYDGIPHLLTPVVTDPHQAIKALKWTVNEMNARYERMCKLGVRNIMGFNQKVARAKRTGEPLARTVQTGFDEQTGSAIYEREPIDPTPMPYIVVVIDEMADLMMVAGKDIEFAVQRLSQMARAAGIHLIMATQRPSVDVITGTIKANFPSRISFQVTSKIDSRTILGEMGAEQLLGAGDMLTMAAGGRIMRAHGPFVSDDEVENIVNFLREQGEPEYIYGVLEDDAGAGEGDNYDDDNSTRSGSSGDVYEEAVQIVLRDRRPTTSYLQRRLGIGYNRAASLIERMESDGIISAPNRTGKREVLAGGQS